MGDLPSTLRAYLLAGRRRESRSGCCYITTGVRPGQLESRRDLVDTAEGSIGAGGSKEGVCQRQVPPLHCSTFLALGGPCPRGTERRKK